MCLALEESVVIAFISRPPRSVYLKQIKNVGLYWNQIWLHNSPTSVSVILLSPEGTCRQVVLLSAYVDMSYTEVYFGWFALFRAYSTLSAIKCIEIINRRLPNTVPLGFRAYWYLESIFGYWFKHFRYHWMLLIGLLVRVCYPKTII